MCRGFLTINYTSYIIPDIWSSIVWDNTGLATGSSYLSASILCPTVRWFCILGPRFGGKLNYKNKLSEN